jgi:hypothetical protein
MTTDYEMDKDALRLRMVAYVRDGRPHFDNVEMIGKVFREQSFMHYIGMDFSDLATLVATEPQLRTAKVVFSATSPGAPLCDVLASTMSRIVFEELEPVAAILSFEFWECRVVGLLARYCEVARHLLRANIGGPDVWWASDIEAACDRLEPVLAGRLQLDVSGLVMTAGDASHALDRAIGSSEVSWMVMKDVGVDRPLARRIADALWNLKCLAEADMPRLEIMVLGELGALAQADDRADWFEQLRLTALPADAADLRRAKAIQPDR